LRKRSVVTAVLIDIRSQVDATIKTGAVKRRRRRRDLFVFDSRPSLKRGGQKSCQRNRGE
jgi:hypothetical protein